MKCLSRVFLFVVLTSMLPLSVWAQAETQWTRMNLVTVKPEYVDDFIELQKAFTARTKDRGVPFRAAWGVGNFGNSYQYAFVTPMKSFAELDGAGTPISDEQRAKFTKYVSARESQASVMYPELSKPLPPGKTPTLAIVTTHTIAPGRNADYIAHVRNTIKPYMSDPKTGIEGFVMLRTIFGGADTWTTVAYISDYSYIDGGSMAGRTLDEAAREAMAKKEVGLVTHTERMIARYIPELSYVLPPSASQEDEQ